MKKEIFPRKWGNFFCGPRTETTFVKWSANRKRLRTAGIEDSPIFSFPLMKVRMIYKESYVKYKLPTVKIQQNRYAFELPNPRLVCQHFFFIFSQLNEDTYNHLQHQQSHSSRFLFHARLKTILDWFHCFRPGAPRMIVC